MDAVIVGRATRLREQLKSRAEAPAVKSEDEANDVEGNKSMLK